MPKDLSMVLMGTEGKQFVSSEAKQPRNAEGSSGSMTFLCRLQVLA